MQILAVETTKIEVLNAAATSIWSTRMGLVRLVRLDLVQEAVAELREEKIVLVVNLWWFAA